MLQIIGGALWVNFLHAKDQYFNLFLQLSRPYREDPNEIQHYALTNSEDPDEMQHYALTNSEDPDEMQHYALTNSEDPDEMQHYALTFS